MKKSLPVAAAVVLLTGCVPMFAASPGDPRPTNVSATDGQLSVDQEPIYVHTAGATITWRVGTFSSLRFPSDGAVTFRDAPEGEFRCNTIQDGRGVICIDRYSKAGRYKYTIRVLQDGKELPPLDPNVVNN
jgi:hypothetical protein